MLAEPTPNEWRATPKSLKDHGLSAGQYDALLELAGDRCEICGGEGRGHGVEGRPFVVDHDHTKMRREPGYVRGLLCGRCNTALATIEDRSWCELVEAYLAAVAAPLAA